MLPTIRLLTMTVLLCFFFTAHAGDLKNIEQELVDSVITAKITAKYTKKSNLNPLKISVTTTNGVVKISGYVSDNVAFVDALRIAKNTNGVDVVDAENLMIKSVNTAAVDTYITAKVEAAILRAKVFDDESIPLVGINVKTTNGIVILTGAVKNSASVTAILRRVNSVHGVKKIISYLQTNVAS